MSFFDIYSRCKISATCRTWMNHDLEVVSGDNIVFERPNWNKKKLKREYYKGTVTYCKRAGCDYEKFEGSRVPWKCTALDLATGEEVEVADEFAA